MSFRTGVRNPWTWIGLAMLVGLALAVSPDQGKAEGAGAPASESKSDSKLDPKAAESKTAETKAAEVKAPESKVGDGAAPGSKPADALATKNPEAQAVVAEVAPKRRSGCIVDDQAIDDIRKRKDELDRRAQELSARETEVSSKERGINEEYKKLTDLRDEIVKLQTTVRKDNEEKIAKIVETMETMSPKGAAQMFNTLDDSLSVAVMTRLSTIKLAKIMNALDPERSVKLTELMAGVVKVKNSISKNTTKGGTNDGFTPVDTSGSGTSRSPGAEKAEAAASGPRS